MEKRVLRKIELKYLVKKNQKTKKMKVDIKYILWSSNK